MPFLLNDPRINVAGEWSGEAPAGSDGVTEAGPGLFDPPYPSREVVQGNRAALMRRVVCGVVGATTTALRRPVLTAAVAGLLNRAMADYERDEILQAIEDVVASGDVSVDGLGRVGPALRVTSVGQVAERAARAEEAAARLADLPCEDLGERREFDVDFVPGMFSARLLNHSETVALAREVEKGNATAKKRIVVANTRLAWSQARRWVRRTTPSMGLDDLFQEAIIGVLRAAEKFDWRRGHHFTTYAMWWIRQGMGRAYAENARTVRLPVHRVDALNRVRRANRALVDAGTAFPSISSVAEKAGFKEEVVHELLHDAGEPESLSEMPNDESDKRTPRCELPWEPWEHVVARLDAEKLEAMLRTLSARERRVLELRRGLKGHHPRTLDEVGRVYNVTRERIRQIEKGALEKLMEAAQDG